MTAHAPIADDSFRLLPSPAEDDGVHAAHDTLPPPSMEPVLDPRALAPAKVLYPTGDRILCRARPHVRSTGLILMVGGDRANMTVSQVLAIGPDVKARPWELYVGDHVLHPRVCGVRLDADLMNFDDHGDLLFIHEHELIGVVSPDVVDRVEGEVNVPVIPASGTSPR